MDVEALWEGRAARLPALSVSLKHGGYQDFDHADDEALEAALAQARAFKRVRAILGEHGAASAVVGRAVSGDPAQDGYRLARELRASLALTAQPIGDLRLLAEALTGTIVLLLPLRSRRVTAVGLAAPDARAIVINANDPFRLRNPLVDRVSVAHELCHCLFDPIESGLHLVLEVGNEGDERERRAKAFAAEFLLPFDGLKLLLGPARGAAGSVEAARLVQTARSRYGTPHEIAVNHLHNHGYFAKEMRDWLVDSMTSFDGTAPEHTMPAPSAPSLGLVASLQRACDQGVVTEADARAALGLDVLAPLPWESVPL